MQYPGVYSAIIRRNNDPNGAGRVTLLIPSLFGAAETGWADPALPGDASFSLPGLGTTCWVAFQAGDRNYPVWFPMALTLPGGWVPAPLVNSWANYGGFGPARYRQEGDVIRVAGLLKSGTYGTTAFTLPYTFLYEQGFNTICGNTPFFNRVDVLPNGAVVPGTNTGSGSPSGVCSYVFLDGISAVLS